MTSAHVSVEVEQDGPNGPSRRRLALSLGLRPRPEFPEPRRYMPGGPRVAAAVPVRAVRLCDERFELAVINLERLGHSRERARHIAAIRMNLPEEDIARLREAAR